MSDTIKVRIYAETGKVGSKTEVTAEFDREEWSAMTDEERDDICSEYMFQLVTWGWNEIA